MVGEPDGDLEVDVLVVGGGIQGLYVAQSLHPKYSVCVLSDPSIGAETLDSPGLISAGYEGNDANRIQPARRAAGFWRVWAESNDVPHDYSPNIYLVPEGEALSRPRMWDDAMLAYHEADELPPIFEGGSLAEAEPWILDNDVVTNPAILLETLRRGVDGCCVEGEIVRFGVVADKYIDHVQVDVGGSTIPIVPRFVVLAAGVGNAELLDMIAKRFADQARRQEGQETARASQAVRHSTVVCVRGPELPRVSGWFGELSIVSQPLTGSSDTVWLVQGPPEDARTVLGPQDLRFDPQVDCAIVADTIERMFACAPAVGKLAQSLRWGVYAARRTQHPMLAVPDSSAIAQPVPAKLEAFGLDAFLTLWPSHLGYAMVLGDVVTERISEALGEPGDFSDGLQSSDLAREPKPLYARWDRSDMGWTDWAGFRSAHGIKAE